MYIMQTQREELKEMSTIRVSTTMKSRLARIAARLTLKDGKTRSMEEILVLLADAYEREETQPQFDKGELDDVTAYDMFTHDYEKRGFENKEKDRTN